MEKKKIASSTLLARTFWSLIIWSQKAKFLVVYIIITIVIITDNSKMYTDDKMKTTNPKAERYHKFTESSKPIRINHQISINVKQTYKHLHNVPCPLCKSKTKQILVSSIIALFQWYYT